MRRASAEHSADTRWRKRDRESSGSHSSALELKPEEDSHNSLAAASPQKQSPHTPVNQRLGRQCSGPPPPPRKGLSCHHSLSAGAPVRRLDFGQPDPAPAEDSSDCQASNAVTQH